MAANLKQIFLTKRIFIPPFTNFKIFFALCLYRRSSVQGVAYGILRSPRGAANVCSPRGVVKMLFHLIDEPVGMAPTVHHVEDITDIYTDTTGKLSVEEDVA